MSKSNKSEALYEKRDKALERVVAAYIKSTSTGEDPDDDRNTAVELNSALDALALAHIAVTLDFVSGT